MDPGNNGSEASAVHENNTCFRGVEGDVRYDGKDQNIGSFL